MLQNFEEQLFHTTPLVDACVTAFRMTFYLRKLAIFIRQLATLTDTNVDITPDRKGVKLLSSPFQNLFKIPPSSLNRYPKQHVQNVDYK